MRFRILGPLEVWSGQNWSGIGAPKWRALLAALLLNADQVVSTDRLIDELWTDAPPVNATNAVAVYVLKLRRLIGDDDGQILATRPPGYQLRLEAGDLDAARFADLVTDGRKALAAGAAERASALLGEALRLWRGEPLADVPPSALVNAEARRLDESRIAAAELRIEAELACGRSAAVVADLQWLTAHHPLREELWALLMRALSAAGRQAEALETYERARRVIADELGVDPGAELQQLHKQILDADAHQASHAPPPGLVPAARAAGSAARAAGSRGDAEAAPLVPSQLPADIPDFTGRGEHVKHLCDFLPDDGEADDRPGAVAVALVVGAGGLGKTTLAIHAAHRLRARFPDGQLWVNLRGASEQPVPPAEILARLLRDLGVHGAKVPVGQDERAALFRTRLAGRRLLIVLDDARDGAQVRAVLPGTASCGVLVTSRNHLPDLASGLLIDLDMLDDDEARALLTRIVGAERLEAEPEATAQVLAACAGLPLAIRIAGARLAARAGWTIETLARRLADERRRIDELKVGDLAVRACFQVSFSSLRPVRPGAVDPARAFRLLGLWQGPSISLRAAAALLGEPEDELADTLEMLVDAHLLQSPAADRYRFHDLLRVYAAERAECEETQPDRDAAIRRAVIWYLYAAAAADRVIAPHREEVPLDPLPPGWPSIGFADIGTALDWCEMERANLVAATIQAAASGLHDIAWKLPVAAHGFLYRRSYWADCLATHRTALASARRAGDRRGEAWVLNNLGLVLGAQRMEGAIGYLEQALTIRREIGDRQGEAQAANNLADTYLILRRFDEALGPLRRSLAIQREVGHRYGEGVALNNLGEAHIGLGRIDDAIVSLQRARVIFGEIGEARGEGHTLHNLGEAYSRLGRVAEAIDAYQRALAIRRAIGERLAEAQTLHELGHLQRSEGWAQQARVSWTRAHVIFRELGDTARAAEVQSHLDAL